MKTHQRAVPAVFALFERHGALLFTLRQNTGYQDGNYGVPAGHVEAGESLTDALVREVAEETGLRIDAKDSELVHLMYRPKKDETGERIDIFFRVLRWDGEPVNAEPQKCVRLAWLPLDALPENVMRFQRHAIECWQRGSVFSEPGWQGEAAI